jgi:hypothetical protein
MLEDEEIATALERRTSGLAVAGLHQHLADGLAMRIWLAPNRPDIGPGLLVRSWVSWITGASWESWRTSLIAASATHGQKMTAAGCAAGDILLDLLVLLGLRELVLEDGEVAAELLRSSRALDLVGAIDVG